MDGTGLTQSYLFKERLLKCEPIDLGRFVVDLRERHLDYWTPYSDINSRECMLECDSEVQTPNPQVARVDNRLSISGAPPPARVSGPSGASIRLPLASEWRKHQVPPRF